MCRFILPEIEFHVPYGEKKSPKFVERSKNIAVTVMASQGG